MSSDFDGDGFTNYKMKYRKLKKHLRALIYENECFQDELRKAQRTFISLSRDKSYLLDRISVYEKPTNLSSDSEGTESSDDEEEAKFAPIIPVAQSQQFAARKNITKRKRSEAEFHNESSNQSNDSYQNFAPIKPKNSKPMVPKNAAPRKPKKPSTRKPAAKREKVTGDSIVPLNIQPMTKGFGNIAKRPLSGDNLIHLGRVTDFPADGIPKYEFASEGHMTREDIERHLEARRVSSELELNTTATVPAELFSQDLEQESELEDSEVCDFTQFDENATGPDTTL